MPSSSSATCNNAVQNQAVTLGKENFIDMNPDMTNNFCSGVRESDLQSMGFKTKTINFIEFHCRKKPGKSTMENDRKITLTKEELENRRLFSLRQSEKAVIKYPDSYGEMKKLLNHVVTKKIDIDEYETIACTLAGLIEKMGTDTIFYHYFHENINPKKMGKAKYFRFFCRDLLGQVDELTKWRHAERNISLIK